MILEADGLEVSGALLTGESASLPRPARLTGYRQGFVANRTPC